MKNLFQIFRVFLNTVLVLLVAPSCEKLGDDRKEGITFPVSRLITDLNGRELQVDILGRSADQITIVRKSDASRFDLPISKLSAADQSFVRRLPVKSAPKVAAGSSAISSTTPLYIRNRLEDIEEMKSDIEFKKAEIKSKSLNPILTNTRRTQIRDLEKEIKRITLDIETYKRNNKL